MPQRREDQSAGCEFLDETFLAASHAQVPTPAEKPGFRPDKKTSGGSGAALSGQETHVAVLGAPNHEWGMG